MQLLYRFSQIRTEFVASGGNHWCRLEKHIPAKLQMSVSDGQVMFHGAQITSIVQKQQQQQQQK